MSTDDISADDRKSFDEWWAESLASFPELPSTKGGAEVMSVLSIVKNEAQKAWFESARRLRAAPREGTEQLLSLLANVRDVAATHHGDQPAHVLLHTLTVEIPEMIDKALAHPARRGGEAGLAKELHALAMNLPCDQSMSDGRYDSAPYTRGFRDARHAIAEALLTHPKLAALAHPPEPYGHELEEGEQRMRDEEAPPEPDQKEAAIPAGDAVLLEMLAGELDEETRQNLDVDGGRSWFTYTEAIRRVLARRPPEPDREDTGATRILGEALAYMAGRKFCTPAEGYKDITQALSAAVYEGYKIGLAESDRATESGSKANGPDAVSTLANGGEEALKLGLVWCDRIRSLESERDRLVRELRLAREAMKDGRRLMTPRRGVFCSTECLGQCEDCRAIARVDAALAQSGGGGGQPDDATLARLEKFKGGHKARACRISIDDGYGATCWAVELDVEGRGTVVVTEAEMMRGGGDWPGLAAVINAALDTAEKLVSVPAGKDKP